METKIKNETYIQEDRMKTIVSTNTLSRYQQLLAKTSLQELLLTSDVGLIERVMNTNNWQHDHPGVKLIGMIGIDTLYARGG